MQEETASSFKVRKEKIEEWGEDKERKDKNKEWLGTRTERQPYTGSEPG